MINIIDRLWGIHSGDEQHYPYDNIMYKEDFEKSIIEYDKLIKNAIIERMNKHAKFMFDIQLSEGLKQIIYLAEVQNDV